MFAEGGDGFFVPSNSRRSYRKQQSLSLQRAGTSLMRRQTSQEAEADQDRRREARETPWDGPERDLDPAPETGGQRWDHQVMKKMKLMR